MRIHITRTDKESGDSVTDEYWVEEALDGAELGDLIDMKLKTKAKLGPDFLGLDVPWIKANLNAGLEKSNEAQRVLADCEERGVEPPEDLTNLDLLGDVEFLYALVGLVWLSRRKAGESLTLQDAGRTSFTDLMFTDDPDTEEVAPEEAEVPDPKVPTSEPAESPEATTPSLPS